MSQPRILDAAMVLRQWDRAHGLRESPQTFSSLEDLFAQCLAAGDPDVIDRIIIRGQDAAGHQRVVTFNFQSITVSTRSE